MARHAFALAAILLLPGGSQSASSLPYNEHADVRAEIRQALAAAKPGGRRVLVIFGANWCGDCRALDKALQAAKNAAWLSEFRVVKVDVGNFDRNLDVAKSFGIPIGSGIPAAAILSPENDVVYATRAGELSNARRMGESGIREFFRKVAAPAKKISGT